MTERPGYKNHSIHSSRYILILKFLRLDSWVVFLQEAPAMSVSPWTQSLFVLTYLLLHLFDHLAHYIVFSRCFYFECCFAWIWQFWKWISFCLSRVWHQSHFSSERRWWKRKVVEAYLRHPDSCGNNNIDIKSLNYTCKILSINNAIYKNF